MSANDTINATVQRVHPQLPIFRIDTPGRCILYTPGNLAVVARSEADAIQEAWSRPGGCQSPVMPQAEAHWLRRRAEIAVEKRAAAIDARFEPECLTVYLSNDCHLACSYCFALEGRSTAGQDARPVIDRVRVESAARLVAENCSRKQKPFQLVIHGGGEPTLHWPLLRQIVAYTRQLAGQHSLGWSGYIATNGILSEERAHWLASHFNAIGLSCDGPPDIQDHQRPLASGQGSSAGVERTAAVIAGSGARIIARATITPLSLQRQVDIADYLCRVIRADEIRFEPAYLQDPMSPAAFKPDQARTYVDHFLQAWRLARRYGRRLTAAGVRPTELHGPFCQVLRQVLQLTPDGSVSACFRCTDGRHSDHQRFVIGHPEPESGQMVLDQAKIQALRRQLALIPDRCRDCLNCLHCSRGCPEVCAAESRGSQAAASAEFRCRVNRDLALAWITESAQEILATQKKPARPASVRRQASVQKMEAWLTQAPSGIDGQSILAQFRALGAGLNVEARKMPLPLWKQRDFEQKGAEAWRQLQQELAENTAGGPISMYVHIPFCQGRCGFCDCLAFSPQRRPKEVEDAYGRLLLAEMDAWASILPLTARPVTTVHFGGGSPHSLDPLLFKRLVDHCRQRFHTGPSTEWAIETTVRLLCDECLGALAELGFTRLHAGVQTLADPLRKSIGRRQDSHAVLQRLGRALGDGFITSVDMMVGLPGQNLEQLAADLAQLMDIGIHGISLYRLNRSSRNRSFFRRFTGWKPDALYDYLLFQAADQLLTRRGFCKNHYTHYAREPNGNLYANHLCRKEDLLALGATADGIFGDYLYRHGGYAAYVKAAAALPSALAGGMRETARERRVRSLSAALMSGRISVAQFQARGAGDLIDAWLRLGFLKPGRRKGQLDLGGNGSWFIYQMIQEIETRIASPWRADGVATL